jgi:hypothetical protein
VNNIKFGVLACGLIGLIAVFLPQVSFGGESITLWGTRSFPGQAAQVYMVMAGYAAGLVMGAMAAAKAPMQRWQSIVALIGFAFVLFKMRNALPFDIFKGAIGAKLMGLAAYAGLIFSIITLAKPETAK